jgi:hypothetical protein
MVAAIGTGDGFSEGCIRGRAGAEANHTGDRTILGKIFHVSTAICVSCSYKAAWVVMVKVKPSRWEGHGLKTQDRDCKEAITPQRDGHRAR